MLNGDLSHSHGLTVTCAPKESYWSPGDCSSPGLTEDVQSARETFKLVGELSIALPSTVLNRYSSLLQRHQLKAPTALLRMKYRQRPPDGSAAGPKVPPAPAWFDKW